MTRPGVTMLENPAGAVGTPISDQRGNEDLGQQIALRPPLGQATGQRPDGLRSGNFGDQTQLCRRHGGQPMESVPSVSDSTGRGDSGL